MHRLITRPSLLLLWALLPAVALVACSDDAAPVKRQIIVEVDPDRLPIDVDDDAPIRYDDAGNPLPPEPPTNPSGRILIIAGDDEKAVHRGGTVELGVLLIDSYGDPVEGERIEYAFVDGDGDGSVLSARRTNTDESGYAKIDLRAGDAVGQHIIEAWNPETRRVRFTVNVVDLPAGGLDIRVAYEGPVPLGRFEVFVVDADDWCEDPYYLVPPENILHSDVLAHEGEQLNVGPLLAGTRLSVVVRGRLADNGVLAAGGCAGEIIVRQDENRRVEVAVFLLPLNVAGTYTAENNFDFTNAIPGTLGDVVRGLVRFFGDQNHEREIAGLIFDLVEGLVREAAGFIGGVVVGLVRGWVEDDLNEIINNYIDNDGPQWLRDFFLIGSDLISVVSNMEVISKLRIGKPRRDGTFDGSQNWIGLAFYWRLPCQNDPDPNCGRHPFTMDEVVAGAEGINLVFGQFTGRVHSYNRGIIDSHTMDLQYGRLILFVLNNLILPAIANGARNLRDALLNLANCPGFANGITGGRSHLRIGGFNIVGRDTIEGWCTTVIGLAGDAANAIIGRLRVDTRLTLEGDMIFVEETDDLIADEIIEGRWRGVIRTADDQGPPFDGSFSGTRDE